MTSASSLVDLFHRHMLSWDYQKLREGSEQFPKVRQSQDDQFLASILNSPPVEIPDRFLDLASYQLAFFRPALCECQAAVIQALPLETQKRGMSVRVTLDRPLANADKEMQSPLNLGVANLPDLVTATCVFEVRFEQPISEQLVLISESPTIAASEQSSAGVLLALTVVPRLSPSSVRLKLSSAAVNKLRSKMDGRWFLTPLYPMTSVGRELQALSDLSAKVPLLEEVLLGSGNGDQTCQSAQGGGDATGLLERIVHPQLVGIMKEKLNESQLGVVSSVLSANNKFLLVQGPPGCGKSHTIHFTANVLHYQQYQQYYEAVLTRVERRQMGDSERDWLELVSLKPRLLLCAQSNVAVENMLTRLVDVAFRDGQGRKYVPELVRVGRGSLTKYSLDVQVEKVLNLSAVELHDKLSKHQSKLNSLRLAVLDLRAKLLCLCLGTPYPMPPGIETRVLITNGGTDYKAYWVDHNKKSTIDRLPAKPSSAGVADQAGRWSVKDMPEWKLFSADLMRQLELWERRYWKVQRLKLAKTLVGGAAGEGGYRMKENMETLILNRATIVLGTLSSCGLPQVKSSHHFQALIVDEACQAVELSTLIPLSLGVKKCVLVGDPQQLPATVLGKREALGNYERSLFERLENCGVKKFLLNIQYRMHPSISLFPRLVFYGDAGGLEDGPNVNQLPFFTKSDYRVQPFTFFDLAEGKERQGALSASKSNLEEAQFVVNLYMTLWQIGLLEQQDLGGRVGIITPYQDQVKLIKQELDRAFPNLNISANEVEVNTVDAYQGREKDVIILSTVRANDKSNTIGFLADLRRMNVAITRSKQGLFIVGKSSSLGVDEIWKLLIDQSRAVNGGFVQVPDPLCDLFAVYRRMGARPLPAVKVAVVTEYISELRKTRGSTNLELSSHP